jgi:large subunit ribosomal protein L7/L12
MNENINKIISLVNDLTLLEINELINNMEKFFSIDTTIAINLNPTSNENIITPEKPEEKTNFEISLEYVPTDKKIAILKIVRTITGLGLKESKDIVDNVPKVLKQNVTKEESEKIKSDIEQLGGKILIK